MSLADRTNLMDLEYIEVIEMKREQNRIEVCDMFIR